MKIVRERLWDSRVTQKMAEGQRKGGMVGTKCLYKSVLLQVISKAHTAEHIKEDRGVIF